MLPPLRHIFAAFHFQIVRHAITPREASLRFQPILPDGYASCIRARRCRHATSAQPYAALFFVID